MEANLAWDETVECVDPTKDAETELRDERDGCAKATDETALGERAEAVGIGDLPPRAAKRADAVGHVHARHQVLLARVGREHGAAVFHQT